MSAALVYTVDEMRALLGLSRNFAYRAVKTGAIPSIRIGHKILIPREHIDLMRSARDESLVAPVSPESGDNAATVRRKPPRRLLRTTRNLIAVETYSFPGVYFLCRSGKVVYVGQSTSAGGRIHSHADRIRFDSAYVFQCDEDILEAVESVFIWHLMPECNRSYQYTTIDVDSDTLRRVRMVVDGFGDGMDETLAKIQRHMKSKKRLKVA